MLWYLPLEQLEERYTLQMYRWVMRAMQKRMVHYTVVDGVPLSKTTEGGQFLNWTSRAYFASSQVMEVARLFHDGAVNPGDIFFVADIWHPGVEAIAYMADALDIPVRLYGINYAGPFDPTDLTAKMLRWGKYQEAAWYAMFTKVFVGSDFHKQTILRGMREAGLPPAENIMVTGLVWDEADAVDGIPDDDDGDDRPIVIWPHRISWDKNPAAFYEMVEVLSEEFPHVRWVISSSRREQKYQPEHPAVEFVTQSKFNYYKMLKRATLMVSTAYHENFGYTIREATALGTPILCPMRACYPEMIETRANLYEDDDEFGARVAVHLMGDEIPVARLKQFRGIEGMLDEMINYTGPRHEIDWRTDTTLKRRPA